MKKFLFLVLLLSTSKSLLATSVVGYWNFDEGFLDQSANSTLTTASNLGIVSGRFARAAYFNGTSGNLRIAGNPIAEDGDGNFSVSFWVQPLAGNTLSTLYDSRGTGINGQYAGLIVSIEDTGNGFVVVANADDGQGNYLLCEGCGSSHQFNSWYHIAVTVETDKMKVFINGQLDSETTGDPLNSITNGLPTLIGATKYLDGIESFYTNQFNGVIDEIRLFDDTLSPSDVQAIYDSTNENVFSTRVGAIRTGESEGNNYQRNTVYKAPSDGVLSVNFGGSKCGNNYALVYTGASQESQTDLAGRINGYNSTSILLSISDYFIIDHYRRYSSCTPIITFRPLF